jgi:hypothetical protein
MIVPKMKNAAMAPTMMTMSTQLLENAVVEDEGKVALGSTDGPQRWQT